MQPMMIVPPQTFSEGDLKLLRDNGICVVEAADPEKVKFVDPLPVVTSRTQIEQASIALSRKLLTKGQCPYDDATRGNLARIFVELLSKGTPLDPAVIEQEQYEKTVFDSAKIDELRRLAREEAKAERAKAKARAAKNQTAEK